MIKKKFYTILLYIAISHFSQNESAFSDAQTIEIYTTQEKIEIEFPKLSTEKYIYTSNTRIKPTEQIENKENKIPTIISDTIHYNYFNNGLVRTAITSQIKNKERIVTTETWTTANPSYLTWKNGALVVGAVAVAYITYMGLQKWKEYQLEKELVAVKTLPQWKMPDSIEDLEQDLQGISNFDEINFPLLYASVLKLTPEQYSYFINEARTWYINNSNQTANTNLLAAHANILKYSAKLNESFPKNDFFFKNIKNINNLVLCNPDDPLSTAYHEAAHALMAGLTSETIISRELNMIPQEMNIPQVNISISIPSLTKKVISKNIWDNALQEFENNMLILLAGGQGYQILKGERLSAHEFLNPEYTKDLGMGTMQDIKDTVSDMSKFKKTCEKYIRLKNNIPESQPLDYQKDILPVAIEMYEKGYDILDAHKDRLRALAQKALKEKIIYQDDIYQTIDIERPQYLHEILIPKPILELGKKASSYLQAVDDINPQDYMLTL